LRVADRAGDRLALLFVEHRRRARFGPARRVGKHASQLLDVLLPWHATLDRYTSGLTAHASGLRPKRSSAGIPEGAEAVLGDAADPAFCTAAAEGAATV
jgi:hypothetical protein